MVLGSNLCTYTWLMDSVVLLSAFTQMPAQGVGSATADSFQISRFIIYVSPYHPMV
jgi:hypothetical protein